MMKIFFSIALVMLSMHPKDTVATRPELSFYMQHQYSFQLCWAAVAASINKFYNPQSTNTQCSIASANLNLSCCSNLGSCDSSYYLHTALASVGNMRGTTLSRPLTMAEIQQEITNGHPICVRFGHIPDPQKIGHFVVIVGYSGHKIYVKDPASVPENKLSQYTLTEFTEYYRGIGIWTHTFFTKGEAE